MGLSDWSAFLGRWSHGGRVIEIVRSGDDVLVISSGVPRDLAPRLEPADPTDPTAPAVIRGGPYHGLTVTTAKREGQSHLVVGGVVHLPRWDTSSPVPPVAGLPAPAVEVTPDTERAYRQLLDQVRAAHGAQVRSPVGVALGSWIRWLTDQQVVLFHGSPDGAIAQLLPRRTSYELNDEAGRGNLGAVYATDDGWWATWFAVVDRARLRGSIRSNVEDFTTADGFRLPVYWFSVDHRELPNRPWRDGWLYVLGRQTFERLPVVPGGPPSHEWCSREAVRPLARIPVASTDFPFLHQVGGHDDGDLLHFEDLADVVHGHTLETRHTDRGVVFRLSWNDDLAMAADEYLRLAHKWMPEVHREIRHDADGVTWLHLDTSPGLVAMVQNRYPDTVSG